ATTTRTIAAMSPAPTLTPAAGARRRQPVRELLEALWRVWRGRDNLLLIWRDDAFDRRLFALRLLFRWVFVVNDPELVKQVLATNVANYRKSVYTERALKPLAGDGLFISHGELWRRQRRIMTPAFHRKRIRGFASDMVRTAREMIERWEMHDESGNGEPLQLHEEMARVTAEVVCRAMFSDDLGADRASAVFESFSRYQESLGKLDMVEVLGLPRWFPRAGTASARLAVAQLDEVLNAIIARRAQEHVHRDDLLGLLLDARDPQTGAGMSRKLLRDEAAVIILAGHETTANALSWAFYLLSQSPQCEARLQQEVDRVLQGREPTYDDLSALPYARAVVDEALRLYPPVHVLSREAVQADSLGGRAVPRGSMVVIAPWILHRHRKLWREPDRFWPERFLPEHAEERSQYSYLPFGAGPRTCLGMGFGITEATLILVMVARQFRLRLAPGHRVEPLGRLTLRPDRGLPMVLERRELATPVRAIEAEPLCIAED
ncbi:MAG: cytochrome P450, partial [Gammaproteobacteria bacterium]